MKPNQEKNSRRVAAKLQLSFAIGIAFWLAGPSSVLSQSVPDRMNYQGVLLQGDGAPVPAVPTEVKFRIYNSSQGGDLMWSRTHIVTPDTNGVFSVVLMDLGSEINGDAPAYTNLADVFTTPGSDLRYLELTVGNSTPIKPRQRFVPSAYAFLAKDALSLNQLPPQDFFLPPGMVAPFAGAVDTNNPPAGWLFCDGSAVSRAKYARLFQAIGTAWGTGNGSTTFNLPDLRGMFLRGYNAGLTDATWKDPDAGGRQARYTGGNSGDAVGSYQVNELKSHTHLIATESGSGVDEPCLVSNISDEGLTWDRIRRFGGYETRPNNAYVNYIVKY